MRAHRKSARLEQMSSVVGWLQRLMMNCSMSDGSAGERKRGFESMRWDGCRASREPLEMQ